MEILTVVYARKEKRITVYGEKMFIHFKNKTKLLTIITFLIKDC